ncbi:BlyB family putative holin accessory protein [Borrelia turicatae]|uniref:BlyB family putative holin accessory protein n=1 Tax=Borrelia turicatae TaxID=142 RepID=UPI000B5A0CFA|nr:BlyB family putative holin accessory protein [Borrelia turicatae]UPA13740.1 biotin--acetyl-CoA-carboxylase ligase [Borrelia turicatae 91E135]UPA13827.1 biotin--acetyl-CoA-carboxylase ligase [Borrelia turicatae 91E135]UPA13883.1 biotin--acetyl-CoA-carboxylase ligase [Borrelia turicatae 91E135]UPA13910.1 biotin--acetyl-CoA-carboxylase ligase [Borrelia turicatae 91E135]UPA15222.1 biotin--acetyl-CoA-carboxylase ligase [Borrelia turicatae]
MILDRNSLDTALNAIKTLFETLYNFEDGSFNENAHKTFMLLNDIYTEYQIIYIKNMERLENALTPQIQATFMPIQTKIKEFIEKVNSNPDNMPLPKEIAQHKKEDL